MEKRILLAFTLSFLVFVFYMRLFAPEMPVEPLEPSAEIGGEAVAGEVAAGAGSDIGGVELEVTPEARPSEEEEAGARANRREARVEHAVEVDTPLYHAVFSNRGANLRSFVLKHHEDQEGEQYEMVPGASDQLNVHPLDVELDGEGRTDRVRNALFETSKEALPLLDEEEAEIEFVWADGRGLEVEKTIRFRGGSYLLDVDVTARHAGVELRKKVFYGPGLGDELVSSRFLQPGKGVIKAGEELKHFSAGDVEDGEGAGVDVAAVGVSSHYFVALMVPSSGSGYGARLYKQSLEPDGGNGPNRDYITAALDVPGVPATVELFLGPKEHNRLEALWPGAGMERVIEYGDWMRHLALPLRRALVWINDYVGNYGWSIVVLTVLINVVLIPLKHHSYVSMRKMQKLSPQIKRIQERFKKLKPTDPRQQDKNKEVYALYKEHNVSPLSGCLPMLLMIPFFFAFYRLLMVSIELRHAPFALWIQDLSTHDPYFVLPILMGVTQIAIQKMSPQTTADPVQAKIMMLMPVMFIFFLAYAPAGLVLYWFVNNLVSIGQQRVTNRLLKEEAPAGDAKSGSGKSRKTKRQG